MKLKVYDTETDSWDAIDGPLCLSKYASLLLSMLAIAIFMSWAEIFMLLLVISLDCF
ncbi:hypothetical protein AHAS_Ahas05G0085000 [Arachis hypogaea]